MKANLDVLLCLTGMLCRQGLIYRAEWVFGVFRGYLFLWIQVAIWRALLEQGGLPSGSPVSLADMVTYLTAVSVLQTATYSSVARDMEDRLRTGDIVGDLLRPTPFPVLVVGRSLGQAAASLVQRAAPVLLLAHLTWGLKPPSTLTGAVIGLLAVILAVAMAYAIAYLLGILGFWVWTTQHFEWLIDGVIRILSGAAIPFWFFPSWLQAIAQVLPFHVLSYTPIALYLGRMAPSEVAVQVATGAGWTLALWAFAWSLWRRALRQIVYQGG